MTDLEITRLCAEAMGWKTWQEKRGDYSLCVTQAPGEDEPWKRLCNSEIEKKRYKSVPLDLAITIGFFGRGLPDPLHDDAQCMALIKKLDVAPYRVGPHDWQASVWSRERNQLVWSTKNVPDLNQVVCECVAKMQQAKIAIKEEVTS